ncbi:uncharacterized protein VP01_3099g3 [Puccinia sorghi]|uniref:Phospholipase/carboxylesterase/thioesterase domain-containing protein n=1 Tax=Puccinia sorghi TaxID=27349 RepID=A0A0L6UZG1_9BASI|nr:uncharacterized protein VP01_3099g3 [Puccinia sorghi]
MDLHTTTRSAATKPAPDFSSLSPAAPVFEYHPSPDGIDTNLLIFFHGLGDTHVPFGQLGRKLNLPQTSWMSIRAFERVPFLEEEAYQWWESFDETGTSGDDGAADVGGTAVTLEGVGDTSLRLRPRGELSCGACPALASFQTPCWSLRLHRLRLRTPPLPPYYPSFLSRPNIRLALDSQGRRRYRQHALAPPASHETMPISPQEWKPILQFWSKFLKSRHPWELNDRDGEESSSFEVRTG